MSSNRLSVEMETTRQRGAIAATHIVHHMPGIVEFSDLTFELAFRADAFRQAFQFHLCCFASLVLVLALGLQDHAFGHIARFLLPLGIGELLLRIYLHRMVDHHRAQRRGASLMVVLTTLAWSAYVVAARSGIEPQPSSSLMTSLIPLLLAVYAPSLSCFFLSPPQKLFACVCSFAAIAAAPSWSSLSTHTEQACVHSFAFTVGVALAYPLEYALRQLALSQIRHELNERVELAERLRLIQRQQEALEKVENEREAERQNREWEHRQEAERLEETWAAHQQASVVEFQRRLAASEAEVKHARRETRWAQSMAVAAASNHYQAYPVGGDAHSPRGPAAGVSSPITPGATKWGDQLAALERKLASGASTHGDRELLHRRPSGISAGDGAYCAWDELTAGNHSAEACTRGGSAFAKG